LQIFITAQKSKKFLSQKTMVQGQLKVISAYKAPAFHTKSSTGAYKKSSPFDFKEQDRKSTSSNVKAGSGDKKADPWGKTFKNESHFKSLHIC
jgi:hypothetical protein